MKKALSLLLALALLSGTAWAATYDVSYPVTGGNLHFNSATGTIVGNDTNAAELVIPGAINGVPVTTIGDSAFVGRSNLTGVTIPDSVTAIEYGAFMFCSNLTSVSIPGSVASIGDYAFSHTGLTSLTIPDSVASIGSKAFQGCDNLISVTVPSSVASLGEGAFWVCRNLTSATILCDITTIEAYTLGGCDKLTSVYIPASVTSIEHHAFMLTPLEDIYYGGSESQWRQIMIDTLEDGNASLFKATVHYNSDAPTAKPKDPPKLAGGLKIFFDVDAGVETNIVGLYYRYTLTNTGDGDITDGHYAFVIANGIEYYNSSGNRYYAAEIIPLTVNLKAGESTSDGYFTNFYWPNISLYDNIKTYLVRFDDQEEEQTFFSDSRLFGKNYGFVYSSGTVRVWDANFMRDIFGMNITLELLEPLPVTAPVEWWLNWYQDE